MSYRDLREWISQVDGIGQLKRLDGVDPHLEMGAITEWMCEEVPSRPSVLFDDIRGYPNGWRVVVNMLNSVERLSLTLGLPIISNPLEFVTTWRERNSGLKPLAPMEVRDSPVLENIQEAGSVDLGIFPNPKWHEEDGGSYFGTGDVVITRDPEDGWVNLGTYRIMLQGKNRLTCFTSRGKHAEIHRAKYFEKHGRCPVAISFGHDPLLQLVSGIEFPFRHSEYDQAGAVKGEPIPVLKGPVTGLPLPATSEVIVEGEWLPDQKAREGPFGEFTGYYASRERDELIIEVKRVMYRNSPILCGQPPLKPSAGSSYHQALLRSALIWDQMEKAGVPDIRQVRCHESVGGRMLILVAIRQRYPGHAKQAAVLASQCKAGVSMGRFVVVVDEDIDLFNTDEVLWALATRCDPERDAELLRRCQSNPLDPAIEPSQPKFNSRMLLDACRPYEWKERFPPVVGSSKEMRRQIVEKWRAKLSS